MQNTSQLSTSSLGMEDSPRSTLAAARRRAGALAGQFPGAAPEAPGARAKRVNAELRVDYWEAEDAMGGPAARAESLAEHPAPGAGNKALPLTRPPFQAQGRLRALDERTGKEYSLEVRALALPVPRPARPPPRPRPRRLGLVGSAPAATGRLTAPHGPPAQVSEGGTVRSSELKKITAPGVPWGLRMYDPGYTNVAAVRSAISYIDGANGVLRYRGYPIEELAEGSSFLETAFLVIYGQLPSGPQLQHWEGSVMRHTALPQGVQVRRRPARPPPAPRGPRRGPRR